MADSFGVGGVAGATFESSVGGLFRAGGESRIAGAEVFREGLRMAAETYHALGKILKESGGGLSFGSMDFESSSTMGTKRWGTTKEVVIGPKGKVVDYSWDYAATRNMVTEIAVRHGWQVKTVISKKKAMW